MKKRARFRPIGRQIILISMLSLSLTIAVIVTVSLLNFRSYSNGIVIERAKVGMSVLQDNLNHELSVLTEQFTAWSADSAAAEALVSHDTAALEQARNRAGDGFLRISDRNGSTIFEGGICPLTGLRMAEIAQEGGVCHGIAADGDSLSAVYAAPFTAGGVTGTLAVGFRLDDSAWMEQVRDLANCEVTLFRDNIRFATTIRNPETNQPVVGTPMADNIRDVVLGAGEPYVGQATIFEVPYFVSYKPLLDVDGEICGAYFSGSNAIEVNRELSRIIVITAVLSALALIATGVILYAFVRRYVTAPIRHVSLLADEMERGNLGGQHAEFSFSENEIGVFARKLQTTKERLSAYIRDIADILAAMGGGDFTHTPSVEYIGDFVTIQESFTEISRRLAQIVGKMNLSAKGVREGSGQIASGSQSLASGSTRQAAAIAEINSTVVEINRQIRASADNASRASGLSANCLQKVQEQDRQMVELLSAMEEIQKKSEDISSIIKAIEDIAFQTNILALNASVEASRAGDAGKGFSVVAEEVRNLAARSSESASATNQLISDTVKAVRQGVRLAHGAAGIMREVMDQTRQTNGIIGEINTAAAVQAETVAQVSSGISKVSGVITQNSATAEETAASCRHLAAQSVMLEEQVELFRVSPEG